MRETIQFSSECDKKFLNWLRTSCVFSVATVATWRSVILITGVRFIETQCIRATRKFLVRGLVFPS